MTMLVLLSISFSKFYHNGPRHKGMVEFDNGMNISEKRVINVSG
jgi:hypothetical protein